MTKPLVILTGPTAAGKTGLSIKLAREINGEIISADSMQVYKMMDIGTAKITKNEMQGVTHHLIDILEPTEEFNVALFKDMAQNAIDGIISRNHIPIIVGGTGFYIQAVLYDTHFTAHETDMALREELYDFARQYGNKALVEKLAEYDGESAKTIHENNVKRVVRALEYCILTGEKFSVHNETERERKSPYNFAYFVLNMDREKLYKRIDKRVDLMVKNGLLEEVSFLKFMGLNKDMVSMKGLGYKEILEYLDGKCTFDEAIHVLKRETRHFAKRQLTWFRREGDVIWLDKTSADEEAILDNILKSLKEKGIIK